MMTRTLTTVVVAGALSMAVVAHAQTVPTSLSVQGVLRDDAGGLTDGQYDMTLSLYANMGDTTAVFEQTSPSVAVESGVFTAVISDAALPDVFVQNSELFLGVFVEGDSAELPRQPLATAPYAFHSEHAAASEDANTLDGLDSAAFQARISSECTAGQFMKGAEASGAPICEAAAGSGDITTVTAGTGLTGGGDVGDVTLDVDTSVIQARVGTSCGVGSSIRVINAAGVVTCETDDVGTGDITEVLAGSGLGGGGDSGSVSLAVDTSLIQARVGTSCGAGSSIRAIDAAGVVTCETDDGGSGDITEVLAGAGLTGGGDTGSVTVSIDASGLTSGTVPVWNGSDFVDSSITSSGTSIAGDVTVGGIRVTESDLATAVVLSGEVSSVYPTPFATIASWNYSTSADTLFNMEVSITGRGSLAGETTVFLVRGFNYGNGSTTDLPDHDDTAPIIGVLHLRTSTNQTRLLNLGPFAGKSGSGWRFIVQYRARGGGTTAYASNVTWTAKDLQYEF